MKEFILDILKRAKTTPFYIWIWISLPVIAFLLATFFGDTAARHPKGTLDTAIFLLMVAFLIGLVILLYFPKGKDLPASNSEKPKKVKKRKGSLQIRIFGRYYPLKPLLFVMLGILCMLFCIISLPFHEIEKFSKTFRGCTFAFILVYIFLYNVISALFSKKKSDDYDLGGLDDMAMYVIGLLLGCGIFVVLGSIALIIWVIIFSVKGIIWLFEFIRDWGFLFYLYI